MAIVMAALCRISTPEAYKKATEIAQNKKLMPEEGRTKVLFAWFSIQMGHYDIAIEILKKTETPSNVREKLLKSSKISSNVVFYALVKSGKVDTCLSEMAKLNNTKFGFTPVYSSELIQEIKEAVICWSYIDYHLECVFLEIFLYIKTAILNHFVML